MEFIQFFNLQQVINLQSIPGNTLEDALDRLTLVKEWMEEKFSDIFEFVITATNNSTYRLSIYFKGTNSGFYLSQTGNGGEFGVLYDKSNSLFVSSCSLLSGTINLAVVKSHYGILAGFYTNSLAVVQAMAVNLGDRLLGLITHNSNLYVVDGQQCAKSLHGSRGNYCTCLSKINLPSFNYIPDGIYYSTGPNINALHPFLMPDGNLYIEPVSPTYSGFALRLSAPLEDDYQNLTSLRSASESV